MHQLFKPPFHLLAQTRMHNLLSHHNFFFHPRKAFRHRQMLSPSSFKLFNIPFSIQFPFYPQSKSIHQYIFHHRYYSKAQISIQKLKQPSIISNFRKPSKSTIQLCYSSQSRNTSQSSS